MVNKGFNYTIHPSNKNVSNVLQAFVLSSENVISESSKCPDVSVWSCEC